MTVQMKTEVQIRWLIRRDMPEVLKIEQMSFGNPWEDEDFLSCLRQRNCIGMVAEDEHQILGFMIYELHKGRLTLIRLAVHPEHRRHGIGTQMIRRLVEKLNRQRRTEIITEVRESNLDAQLFFRSRRFIAIQIFREAYENKEDGYLFSYQLHPENAFASGI